LGESQEKKGKLLKKKTRKEFESTMKKGCGEQARLGREPII